MKNRNFINRIALSTALAGIIGAAAVIPQQATAEQTQMTGAGALSTAARLDFSIVIPRFLRFRVGTASGTIDLITFSPSAAVVGDGSAVAGAGGDAGGGAENVSVLANSGQVTIATTTSTATGLSDGAGNFINYNQISTVSSIPGTLPAPVLANSGIASVTPTISSGAGANAVTNRVGTWTYTYLNTIAGGVPPAGTYGGVNTNGGRVTYTASSP